MGQKTHPNGFRIGITKTHNSTWFESYGNYKNILHKKSSAIKLTIKESKVLLYLYKNIGNDVEREDLATEINVSTRSVDVLVKRLRSKILSLPQSKNILLTSRGIGYRLDP